MPHSPPTEPEAGCDATPDTPHEVPFDYEQETVEIPPMSDEDFRRLQRQVLFSLTRTHLTPANVLKHLRTLQPWADAIGQGFGGAYLDTLIDPDVIAAAHGGGGHGLGNLRITNTEAFMRDTLTATPGKSRFENAVTTVNRKHVGAGVVNWKEDGGVEVDPSYRDSFTYVVAVIVDHLCHSLEKQNVPPRELERLSQLCFQFVYQLGAKIGLRRMPKDLAAHDHFVASHRRMIKEKLSAMPRMQRRAADIAWGVIPAMAARIGMPVRTFLTTYVTQEVRDRLGLFVDEQRLVDAQEKADRLFEKRFSAVARLRTLVHRGMEATIGRPAHLEALNEADETLTTARDAKTREALANGGDILQTLKNTDEHRVVQALREYAEYDRQMRFDIRTYRKGQKIVTQGEQKDEMYILLKTSHPLEVVAHEPEHGRGGAGTTVARFAEPGPIGEISLKKNIAPIADVVVAEGEATVLGITKDQFHTLWQYSPHFARGITRLVQKRILGTSAALARERSLRKVDVLIAGLQALLENDDPSILQRDFQWTHVTAEDVHEFLDALERGLREREETEEGTGLQTGELEETFKRLETLAEQRYPQQSSHAA